MREYRERAFGSPSLSSVFVFGFSKKNLAHGRKVQFFFRNIMKKRFLVCVIVQDKLIFQFI